MLDLEPPSEKSGYGPADFCYFIIYDFCSLPLLYKALKILFLALLKALQNMQKFLPRVY